MVMGTIGTNRTDTVCVCDGKAHCCTFTCVSHFSPIAVANGFEVWAGGGFFL